MRAEIISIGTEILLGEITDTNSTYLSQKLAEFGINVYKKTTVGDNEQAIIKAVEEASLVNDLVITIGGLGPTADDITKATLAKFLHQNLVFDKATLKHINKHFSLQHKPITENNKKQAQYLEGSTILPNDNGLAIGNYVKGPMSHYLILPGPPSEFIPMVKQTVLPLIAKMAGVNHTIQSKTLHFVGIGESTLADKLANIIDNQTNPTFALYFKPSDVTVRITAKAQSKTEADGLLDKAKQAVLAKVGEYFYAEGENVEFNQFVMQKLIEQNITITAAESLTGGLFQSTMVQTPGVSKIFSGGFVTYADDVKTDLIDVDSKTIARDSVVSQSVAEQMAMGAKQKMKSDIAISFTGVAGPDDLEGNPVGTVWIGLALKNNQVITKEFHFQGNREKIRHLAVMNGLYMIFNNVIKK